MSFLKESLLDCVGAVNIVTANNLLLQGQIIESSIRKHDFSPQFNLDIDPEFVTLELTCNAMLLTPAGVLTVISPLLFTTGDRVRVNLGDISAIGPSHGCVPVTTA